MTFDKQDMRIIRDTLVEMNAAATQETLSKALVPKILHQMNE